MPKPPLPADLIELLSQPNPAVVGVLTPSGAPMTVPTWYLWEEDGTVLLNMDAVRARLKWLEQRPVASLTAFKADDFYRPVSVRGPIVRWERDRDKAMADIDRLSRHYLGHDYHLRDQHRVSAWMAVEHWHG